MTPLTLTQEKILTKVKKSSRTVKTNKTSCNGENKGETPKAISETYASVTKKVNLPLDSESNDDYTLVTRGTKNNQNHSKRMPYNVDKILSLKNYAQDARIKGLNNLRQNLIDANLSSAPAVKKILKDRKYASFKTCLFNIKEKCRNSDNPYCSNGDLKYFHACIYCKILFAVVERGYHSTNCPLTQ